SFEEALWYKDFEPVVRGHTTERGGGIVFHGHGFGEGSSEEDLKVFFRQVDAAVNEVMPTPETPVVLAGVDHLHPVYREISNLFVVEAGIEGNPEHLSPEELHEQAWPMVDQLFRERRE